MSPAISCLPYPDLTASKNHQPLNSDSHPVLCSDHQVIMGRALFWIPGQLPQYIVVPHCDWMRVSTLCMRPHFGFFSYDSYSEVIRLDTC